MEGLSEPCSGGCIRVGWAVFHYQGLCCTSRKQQLGGWEQVVEGHRSVPRVEANHPHGELRQLNSHTLGEGLTPRTRGLEGMEVDH